MPPSCSSSVIFTIIRKFKLSGTPHEPNEPKINLHGFVSGIDR
jgi:hypothetical protein